MCFSHEVCVSVCFFVVVFFVFFVFYCMFRPEVFFRSIFWA